MKKQLGKRAILNRLQKRLNELFTEEEQENIGIDIDSEGSDFYIWHLICKGRSIDLVCNKYTGVITTCYNSLVKGIQI